MTETLTSLFSRVALTDIIFLIFLIVAPCLPIMRPKIEGSALTFKETRSISAASSISNLSLLVMPAIKKLSNLFMLKAPFQGFNNSFTAGETLAPLFTQSSSCLLSMFFLFFEGYHVPKVAAGLPVTFFFSSMTTTR